MLLLRHTCVLVVKLPLILQLWVQSHKQSLQRKLQERHVEVQSKQEQLGSVLQESDALRAVIAGQTVNKDDVVRMNQEKWAPCRSCACLDIPVIRLRHLLARGWEESLIHAGLEQVGPACVCFNCRINIGINLLNAPHDRPGNQSCLCLCKIACATQMLFIRFDIHVV